MPTHLQAEQWPQVSRLATELGQQGLMHPVVVVWKPGAESDVVHLIDQIQQIYQED
ncbi:hypothetical protein ACQKDS_18725 [Serratia sp. NPDC078593]|uniref:hypothetical protein n=1 Tax=unclassified Serratia (in: enterobacteria) TaxID=2647522 RepID=UPI0037D87DC4